MWRPLLLISCAAIMLDTPLAARQDAVPAAAQLVPIPDASVSAATPAANEETTTEALLSLGDNYRRMTLPVSIDGQGPFPFIIDTGAERTVISRQLARVLNLKAGPRVTVAAITGRSAVGTFVIPMLATASFADSRDIAAPGLDKYDLGAHGLLGLDVLEGHLVKFDFDRNLMAVKPSKVRPRHSRFARSDEIVVTAKRMHHRLVVTDAKYRGRPIRVMIDTGSTVSLGNPAFEKLISAKHLSDPFTVRSVTGDEIVGRYTLVDDLRLGSLTYNDLPIVFSGEPPFEAFAFGDKPVLILGMDALRVFPSVEIDFANANIRFGLHGRQRGGTMWN